MASALKPKEQRTEIEALAILALGRESDAIDAEPPNLMYRSPETDKRAVLGASASKACSGQWARLAMHVSKRCPCCATSRVEVQKDCR